MNDKFFVGQPVFYSAFLTEEGQDTIASFAKGFYYLEKKDFIAFREHHLKPIQRVRCLRSGYYGEMGTLVGVLHSTEVLNEGSVSYLVNLDCFSHLLAWKPDETIALHRDEFEGIE